MFMQDNINSLLQDMGNTYFKFTKLQESFETTLADLENLKDLEFINEDETIVHLKELLDTFNCYCQLSVHALKILDSHAKRLLEE